MTLYFAKTFLVFITTGLIVAKCKFIYTEQNFQTKFYPKKNAKIATMLALKLNKTDKRELCQISLTQIS